MSLLQFSVLTTWYNRDELRLTLRENARWFERHSAEILVINCGGDTDYLRHLILESGATGVRQINIPNVSFNKCLALNIGIHCSRNPWIFTVDADLILQSDVLEESLPFLHPGSLVTMRWLHESLNMDDAKPAAAASATLDLGNDSFLESIYRTHTLEMNFRDGTSVSVPTYHYGKGRRGKGSRIGSGQLLVSKQDILAVGGYNSNIRQWGWEDYDIQIRLKKMLLLKHIEVGEAIHLTHGNEKRDLLSGQTQSQTDVMNFRYICSCYAAGNFKGTYLKDIEEWAHFATEDVVSMNLA